MRTITMEVIRSKKNRQFSWHVTSSNGRLIATSGEQYKQRQNATKSFHSFVDHVLAGKLFVKAAPIRRGQ